MKLEKFLQLDLKDEGTKSRFPNLTLDAVKEVQVIAKHHSLGKNLKDPCEKCGEHEVYCGYADVGAMDYYDNYWHICMNCLDARHYEDYNQAGMEPEQTPCPFCKKED